MYLGVHRRRQLELLHVEDLLHRRRALALGRQETSRGTLPRTVQGEVQADRVGAEDGRAGGVVDDGWPAKKKMGVEG
jgi:hypothetical protein